MLIKMIYFIVFGAVCSVLSLSAGHHNPQYKPNRSVIVHLFEWKFTDIADECEVFLAPHGFGGVQVSPVSENVIIEHRPWWERYQPISYRIITRSGDEREFANMVQRCNRVGVRVYVDVILNHMAAKQGHVIGTGNGNANVARRSYPEVPYGPNDFHQSCAIHGESYGTNANEVRNCELVGLPDLNQGSPYVREKIVDFLNRLIGHGVAGFRIDAAKHMWPKDLEAIYGGIYDLKTPEFPGNSKAFIYQEVIDLGGEAVTLNEYSSLGAVTEFRHSNEIGKAFNGGNDLKWLMSWGTDWGFLPSAQAFIFIDNHDNQRGHGSGSNNILTHKSPRRYVMATAFMLAHSYGIPRVMSSFHFDATDQGPPSDKNGHTISPAFDSSGQCTNGWVCEHRWSAICNMVAFRNVVRNAPVVNFWHNGKNQIAFSRGTRGFIALNNEPFDMNITLFTSLPSGEYCDIIAGNVVENDRCTGPKLIVDENGKAQIHVSINVGVLAIHIGEQSRIDRTTRTTSEPAAAA